MENNQQNTADSQDKKSRALTRLKGLLSGASPILLIIITLGQWHDAKDILNKVYQTVISQFTHQVEYQQLQKIHVGITKQYLKKNLGLAKVVKRSKEAPEVLFEYYFHPKFLLTTLSQENRVVGYSVVSLKESFSPPIPYSQYNMREHNIGTVTTDIGTEYTSNLANINFFLQQENLGKNGLFMNRVLGKVEYLNQNTKFVSLLTTLERAEVTQDHKKSLNSVSQLREHITPNYFAISETPLNVVAESMLTKYEYHLLK